MFALKGRLKKSTLLTLRRYLFLFGEYFTMIFRCKLPIIHTRVIGHSDLSISLLSLTTVEYLWRETRVKRVTMLWYTIKHTGIFRMNKLNLISLIVLPCMSGFIVDLITSCVGSTITKRSSSSVRLEFTHIRYIPSHSSPSHPSFRFQSRSSHLNVSGLSLKYYATLPLIICFHPLISTSVHLPLLYDVMIEMWIRLFF